MRIPAYPSRRAMARTAGAALVVAALALGACSKTAATTGSGNLGNQNGTPTPTPSVAPSVTGGGATSAPPPSSTATASHSTSGGGNGGSTVSLTLAITQEPACPVVATSDSPFSAPGSDIIIHWTVSGGATGVAVSMDNPNFFSQYHTGSQQNFNGKSGDAELPFSCDITVQPNTKHVYTFDTLGGGKSVEKSISVTKQTSP